MSSGINVTWFKKCPVNVSDNQSFGLAIFRTFAKIFEYFSYDIFKDCLMAFNIPDAAELANKQKIN